MKKLLRTLEITLLALGVLLIGLTVLGCEVEPCYETTTYFVNGVPTTISVEIDCHLMAHSYDNSKVLLIETDSIK